MRTVLSDVKMGRKVVAKAIANGSGIDVEFITAEGKKAEVYLYAKGSKVVAEIFCGEAMEAIHTLVPA